MASTVDARELEAKVKEMYREVAEHHEGTFHFEMGRAMAERLGYAPALLDRIPVESTASFAGVGHVFHLADLRAGESVVDLGSGSGMDSFLAALAVAPGGRVVGIDVTDAQVAKASRLRDAAGLSHVDFRAGTIDDTGLPSDSFD